MKAALWIASILIAIPSAATTINGRVTDGKRGNKGIEGVEVKVWANNQKEQIAGVFTNAVGKYEIAELPARKVIVTFMRQGYVPNPHKTELTLRKGERVTIGDVIMIEQGQTASYYQEVAKRIAFADAQTRESLEKTADMLPSADRTTLRTELAGIDATIKQYAAAFAARPDEVLAWLRKGWAAGHFDVAPNLVTVAFPAAFRLKSAKLKETSRDDIEELAAAVSKLSYSDVTIFGFTDATGASDYNLRLSKRRAKSASDVFLAHNIEPLIEGKGAANYQHLKLAKNDPALRSVIVTVELKNPE